MHHLRGTYSDRSFPDLRPMTNTLFARRRSKRGLSDKRRSFEGRLALMVRSALEKHAEVHISSKNMIITTKLLCKQRS